MAGYVRKHDRTRPRGWFSLFVRLGGWGALIAGIVLLALTTFSAINLRIADRLDADGRFARAVVVDREMVQSTDSDGDTTYSHYLTFRFKTEDGGRTQRVRVGSDYYSDALVGDERVIRYLRGDPATLETEVGAYRRVGTVLRWIGLAFGIAGLVTLWSFGQAANRAIRARRDGEKRRAVVTEIRDTAVRVNNRRQARLIWREEDGRTGRSLMRAGEELRRLYDAGDEIVVFRLGRHAFWEGDVGPPAREVGLEP